MGGEFYEVTVTVTITVKLGERVAYLVEVQQSGEFQTSGFEGEELRQLLGIYCPGVLYPFLRETVASLVAKGGFPPDARTGQLRRAVSSAPAERQGGAAAVRRRLNARADARH